MLCNSGQTLTIQASGTLLETIEKGATVALEVKWGLITLIQQTVDLCDQLKNVDMECPLKKGKMILTKEVDLPKQIPPVCTGQFDDLDSVSSDIYARRVNTPFLRMSMTRIRSRSPV